MTVPFFCPEVPPLKDNPVFLYYPDSFQKPNPFQPDIAVSIDAVMEKKLDALGVIVSHDIDEVLPRADVEEHVVIPALTRRRANREMKYAATPRSDANRAPSTAGNPYSPSW